MYYFEARYFDYVNDREITRDIFVDGSPSNDEMEIYIYAMRTAYKMIMENEMFVSLELISY